MSMTTPSLKALLDEHYEMMDGSEVVESYHDRHSTQTAGILTVIDDATAADVVAYLEPRITGKIVVEVGAGIGLLACHMAMVARRVYAIEVDPSWTSCFLAAMYARKPKNLSFIFGAADEAPALTADVAVFCTHSGHSSLYTAASRFAPIVIDVYRELMPPCGHPGDFTRCPSCLLAAAER